MGGWWIRQLYEGGGEGLGGIGVERWWWRRGGGSNSAEVSQWVTTGTLTVSRVQWNLHSADCPKPPGGSGGGYWGWAELKFFCITWRANHPANIQD